MIDLHTHTTASDGRHAPVELVARAIAAGVTVLAVTDHDTIAGCDEAEGACRSAGIAFVNGIEITAMRDDSDVHVLAYFFDRQAPALLRFLADQRQQRVERLLEIVRLLARHGVVLDADAIVRPALDDSTKAAGRPWIARALVAGGFVKNTNEAFDRWLSRGRPAYAPRNASAPSDVFSRIHEAGGIASLAHPIHVGHDEWIEPFAADGLDAIEAYHSDQDAAATARYLSLAARLGLAVSGGSDYHGDPAHGPTSPGDMSVPREHYDRLVRLKPDTTFTSAERRATIRATASGDATSS